jgi:hypothetical protein
MKTIELRDVMSYILVQLKWLSTQHAASIIRVEECYEKCIQQQADTLKLRHRACHPDDGEHIFPRNVGPYNSHTASHHRRRHFS